MLIHPGLGSYAFIGCLLTDLVLEYDPPFGAQRCGTCTRCLDACPTHAFPEPHVLDARRCISYLTIEARSEPPGDLRPLIGDHLFGCDICQEVCPWNVRFAAESRADAYRPREPDEWPTLDEILAMDEADFERAFGATAIERTRLAGLKRNARVVAENRSPARP
jgi:epoxyqueuosine reductase